MVCCDVSDVNQSVSMLAQSIASWIYCLIDCAVFASPHGGFFAVASDDIRPGAVHRGNPGERGTTDAIVRSSSLVHQGDKVRVWVCMSVCPCLRVPGTTPIAITTSHFSGVPPMKVNSFDVVWSNRNKSPMRWSEDGAIYETRNLWSVWRREHRNRLIYIGHIRT